MTKSLTNLTPSGVEREPAKRFHALGQTSAIAPLWYIWEKGADRVIMRGITSQETAEQIAEALNRHAAPSRETFFSYERPVDAMMSGQPSDQALTLPSEPPSQAEQPLLEHLEHVMSCLLHGAVESPDYTEEELGKLPRWMTDVQDMLIKVRAALAAQPSQGDVEGRADWRFDMKSAPANCLIFDPKWGVYEGLRFDGGNWGIATFNGSIIGASPVAWRPKPEAPALNQGADDGR